MNINISSVSYSNNQSPSIQHDKHHEVIIQAQHTNEIAKAQEIKAEQEKEARDDLLEKSIQQANVSLSSSNRYFQRQVHEKTGAIIYTLHDSSTKEVLAEFPQKKLQDMIAGMWEDMGLFIDKKA